MTASDTEPGGTREVRSVNDWQSLEADDLAAGKRLDQWLAQKLGPHMSRNRVQDMIAAGQVKLNGAATSSKSRLNTGDTVSWQIPEAEAAEPEAQDIPLDILFEDNDLIVINKPAGLVVHPGAGNSDGTLVNALLAHCGDTLSGIGGVKRPGIVHRLDKDTSGVMVVAKNDAAHQYLSALFADHGRSGTLERGYHAVVWGAPSRQKGIVDAPLGRSPQSRIKRAVVPAGRSDAREAITHFQVLQRFGQKNDGSAVASKVECRLETGRTHQIRVHMAHIGHPLIGDTVYGKSFLTKISTLPNDAAPVVGGFTRQALHAYLLAFEHPVSREKLRFEAPNPPDFERLVSVLSQI